MADVAVLTKADPRPFTLSRTKMQPVGYDSYAEMSATIEAGISFEECLKAECWVHVCDLFKKQPLTNEPDKAGSIIHIRTEDHAFYARLYVRAVLERGLVVETLEYRELGAALKESAAFKSQWVPGNRSWNIIRLSDREIVARGLKTKEAVNDWIGKMGG